jgi:predicted dehydrogenase
MTPTDPGTATGDIGPDAISPDAISPGAIGMAVIGAGYWGPNLVRNIAGSASCDLRWVCDLDVARATKAVGRYSTIRVTDDIDEVLNDPAVQAVAVATPAHTHTEVALACLNAGKHVLVEKPLAGTVAEGEKLVEAADDLGLVLMCDHTYCYTPAVQEIRRLVRDGHVGDIHYVDSVRINLGLLQPDIDVFWDLAPHDLAILDVILPERSRPVAVSAQGADPLDTGFACVGYLTLRLEGGAVAHTHVNWLSPTKVRTTIIGGSERMVVWDDLNPSQRLCLYDKGVDITDLGRSERADLRRERTVSYRSGDLSAPTLPEHEALGSVISEFAASIREGRAPLTDGHAGLRVLRILEAATTSLRHDGATIPLHEPALG